MAALDFPANPTVGQQYAAPNGITYQWDGAAWVVTGGPPATPTGPAGGDLAGSTYPNPIITANAVSYAKLAGAVQLNIPPLAPQLPQDVGKVATVNASGQAVWQASGAAGAAGGSLAGTYPNPSVAASAIRGTPSSGGTAREIQKASIWGGDDLINASVPWAKLGADPTYARVYRAANPQTTTTGAFLILTFDTITVNQGGMYSTGATDRFTVATQGIYTFGAACEIDSSTGGTRRILYINVNSAALAGAETAQGAARNLAVEITTLVPAGGIVQASVYQDSGVSLFVRTGTVLPTMWIARVG